MIALAIIDALGQAAGEHPRAALTVVFIGLCFAGLGWLALGTAVALFLAARVADRVDRRRARRRYGLDVRSSAWGRR